MIVRLLNSLRSINDPLRSPGAAANWIASLPARMRRPSRKRRSISSAGLPSPARQIGPHQVEALLKVDARLEPVIAELTQDYTANYQKSTEVELRLWHLVFDLVKAFSAAYQAALRVGYPRADDRRWRAVLPWVLVRLAYYKGQDGKFRLFRYSRWTPAQWREFHELYEFARMRGWQREQLVLGAATFSRPGVCLEQEYLQTLLLMRLDSGNFTADQVEWIARQLEDWSPSLTLVPPPGNGASFFVDLTGAQGLRRAGPPAHGRARAVSRRAGPSTRGSSSACAGCPSRTNRTKPGDLPVREQRLLLMRLAALFGPDTLAISPRAARYAIDTEVRVVFGLEALCEAIGETEQPAADAADGGLAAARRGGTLVPSRPATPTCRRAASAATCGRWRTRAKPGAG